VDRKKTPGFGGTRTRMLNNNCCYEIRTGSPSKQERCEKYAIFGQL